MQDPVDALNEKRTANEAPSCETESVRSVFDSKQIVELGVCVVHLATGTVCGVARSLVKPPADAPSLSPYCMNVLDVSQDDVNAALPLVDVLQRVEAWVLDVVGRAPSGAPPEGGCDAVGPTTHVICGRVSARSAAVCPPAQVDDSEGTDEDSQADTPDANGDVEGASVRDRKKDEDGDDDVDHVEHAASTSGASIVLAVDGIPSIASVFHGRQQYMAPATSGASAGTMKPFSFLNTLSAAVFHRYVDVRETFHRYFRVPTTVRIPLHDMLRELRLPFRGAAHSAPDVAFNVARVLVASMKKGCVFRHALECHARHEQAKVVSAAPPAAAGGATVAATQAGIPPAQPDRNVSSLLATQADVKGLRTVEVTVHDAQRRPSWDAILHAVIASEVFLRWAACIFLVLGIAWNSRLGVRDAFATVIPVS